MLLVALMVVLATVLGLSAWQELGGRQTTTQTVVDVETLLGLPRVSEREPARGPYLALFVSSYWLCPEALTEIHEYLLLLSSTEPKPDVVHLLLEHDAAKARHFSESRDLGLPVLFGASDELLDRLYYGIDSPVGRSPGSASAEHDLTTSSRPPTVFFIDTADGVVLRRQFITNYVTSPLRKAHLILDALPISSTTGDS